MNLIIVEGLDKTGKTTYTRNRFNEYTKIRMPGGSDYSQELRRYFLEGKIPTAEMIHLIFGEHMALLEKLQRENTCNYILDRSFISYLVYQRQYLKEYGFYEIYKKLLEDKFKILAAMYNVKIFYFCKQLIEKKEDWLECMDTKELKNNFDTLLNEALYKQYVECISLEIEE